MTRSRRLWHDLNIHLTVQSLKYFIQKEQYILSPTKKQKQKQKKKRKKPIRGMVNQGKHAVNK